MMNDRISIKVDHAEISIKDRYGNTKCFALIDLDDVEKVKDFKWCVDGRGYVISDKLGKRLRLHRYVLGLDKNDKCDVDHINRDRLDCRKNNLRVCSRQENKSNNSLNSNNKSGVTGVNWDKKSKKWRAFIRVNYKQINLGRYTELRDAIEVRLDAEREYFGEFAPTHKY